MTITEASAVNRLIDWIIYGKTPGLGDPISDQEALDAAVILSRSAHKALSAGYDPIGVQRAWPKRRFKGVR